MSSVKAIGPLKTRATFSEHIKKLQNLSPGAPNAPKQDSRDSRWFSWASRDPSSGYPPAAWCARWFRWAVWMPPYTQRRCWRCRNSLWPGCPCSGMGHSSLRVPGIPRHSFPRGPSLSMPGRAACRHGAALWAVRILLKSVSTGKPGWDRFVSLGKYKWK